MTCLVKIDDDIKQSRVQGRMQGFSLLELSIALVIMAFLGYTIAQGVESTRDHDRYFNNQQYMSSVKKSLLIFVQANGFLPCPDTDSVADGVENRIAGVCHRKKGFLPYKMLGVKAVDAWNQPLYYAINAQADAAGIVKITDTEESAAYFYSVIAPNFTTLTKPFGVTGGRGNINICGESTAVNCKGAGNADTANKIERRAIAVVVSFGENGPQTWARYPISGGRYTLAEDENIDGDNFYWQARGSNIEGAFFDDQLVWLTGYEVKYALLRSERGLPLP